MKDFNRYHILFLTTYQNVKENVRLKMKKMYKRVDLLQRDSMHGLKHSGEP